MAENSTMVSTSGPSSFETTPPVTTTILLWLGTAGFVLGLALVALSLNTVQLKKKYGLLIGLLILECACCFGRMLSGWERSKAIVHLVPLSYCVYRLFPLLIMISWLFPPPLLLCLALKQMTAVLFPNFFRSKWRPALDWYIDLGILAAILTVVSAVAVGNLVSDEMANSTCPMRVVTGPTAEVIIISSPSAFISVSCIVTAWTLVVIRRWCHRVSPPEAVSSNGDSSNRKAVYATKYLVFMCVFDVILVMFPSLMSVMSHSTMTANRVIRTIGKFSSITYTVKSIVIFFIAGSLPDYRRAARETFNLCSERVMKCIASFT